MTRRLGSGVPRFDRDRTLYALRDNLGKADAYISSAERLIEETPWDIRGDEGDEDEDDQDDEDDRTTRTRAAIASAAARTTWRT